jgi:ABC-type sugar transport system permease subunit
VTRTDTARPVTLLARPRRTRTPALFPLLCLAPALILLLVFVAYPILESVRVSFGSWDGVGAVVFRGLANYTRLFTDGVFASSLITSLEFFAIVTIVTVVLAVLLANAVSRGVPGRSFFRVVWFLPVIVPVTVSGVFWASAFQPTTGIVNTLLGAVGLGSTHSWLASGSTVIYVVAFASVWTQAGYAMLLLLGAMESVPVEVHEAAELDGVGPVARLFRITLPIIFPMLGTVTVLMAVFSFNAFGIIYGMTNGGPGNASSILPVLVYKESFLQQDYGYGSATAVITCLVVGIIGIAVLRIFRQQSIESQ